MKTKLIEMENYLTTNIAFLTTCIKDDGYNQDIVDNLRQLQHILAMLND